MRSRIQTWSWRGLRALSGLQERLRRRLSPTGQMIFAATFAAGLIGADTKQTLAFQAFGLGCGLLILAWLAGRRRPKHIGVRRQLPAYATLGETLSYRVELENLGKTRLTELEICENLPDPRPDLVTFLQSETLDELKHNPFDRLFAYPRWRRLLQLGSWAHPQAPAAIPGLAPGAAHSVQLKLLPQRRGILRLESLRIARLDPLGLYRSLLQPGLANRLLVLPKRYAVAPQRPPGRRRLQPGGLSLASSVGDSREFIGLRDYQPGDSPRHLHWAAWARSGKPVVKEYQDEYFSRQALILDNFVRPGQENEFEAAVSVAASFVEPLQSPDALLDLMFVADQAYTLTSGRGLLSSSALLEVLACVQARPNQGFDSLQQAVLQHAPLLSACICVVMDWDSPRQKLVEGLLGLGLPVQVLLLGGPENPEAGPMARQPRHLHRLHTDRLEQGLMAL